MSAQDIRIFLPVKIYDRQWAEKLLDGSVFMRSLFEYGSWNKAKYQTTEMNNPFRGGHSRGHIEKY
jgi:hypothetical protein